VTYALDMPPVLGGSLADSTELLEGNGCGAIIDGGAYDQWPTAAKAEALKRAQMKKREELKEKKAALEEKLKLKLEQLYELCIKESDLTGILPDDTPRIPGKPTPTIRKRIGTTFSFSPKFLSPEGETSKLRELEMTFEIQQKQMEASLRLSQDKTLARNVRRKHRQAYRDAHLKLKELEEKLNMYRRQAGRSLVNIPDTIEDTDDLLLSMHPHDAAGTNDSESNTSELSYTSEPRNRSQHRMHRSKSAVPPTQQLLHASESMPKMEIQEYDKPLMLRSPVRSSSSTSLKEQLSPDRTPEIKIYRKVVQPTAMQQQQRSSYMKPMKATYQFGSAVNSTLSQGSTTHARKSQHHNQVRTPSSRSSTQLQQDPSSPEQLSWGCDYSSDSFSVSSQPAGGGEGSRGAGSVSERDLASRRHHHRTRADNQYGLRSTVTSCSAVNSPELQNVNDFTPNGIEYAIDNGNDDSPSLAYEEQTSTWPRKRGGRNSRRRQSDEHLTPSAPSSDIIETPPTGRTGSASDLFQLSPSKYGSKREDSFIESPFCTTTDTISGHDDVIPCRQHDGDSTPNVYGAVIDQSSGQVVANRVGHHREQRLAAVSDFGARSPVRVDDNVVTATPLQRRPLPTNWEPHEPEQHRSSSSSARSTPTNQMTLAEQLLTPQYRHSGSVAAPLRYVPSSGVSSGRNTVAYTSPVQTRYGAGAEHQQQQRIDPNPLPYTSCGGGVFPGSSLHPTTLSFQHPTSPKVPYSPHIPPNAKPTDDRRGAVDVLFDTLSWSADSRSTSVTSTAFVQDNLAPCPPATMHHATDPGHWTASGPGHSTDASEQC
jgi:hypothetical protein